MQQRYRTPPRKTRDATPFNDPEQRCTRLQRLVYFPRSKGTKVSGDGKSAVFPIPVFTRTYAEGGADENRKTGFMLGNVIIVVHLLRWNDTQYFLNFKYI